MVEEILAENERRQQRMHAVFDPITGEGSVGRRQKVSIAGLTPAVMWLPEPMLQEPLVRALVDAGSVGGYLLRQGMSAPDYNEGSDTRGSVEERFERLRCVHDFAYWAAKYVYIKRKGGGDDMLFRLSYPQRIFVERLEDCRVAGRPIRIVLLKARQWGGSTTSQLYMAWLQLIHCTGLNSLIIAHQGTASDEIKDMFDRALRQYPLAMLHAPGEEFSPKEKKIEGVGRSGATFRVPQRNCKVKIGTAERPHSCRGGDYNLVHLSEVGLWKTTDGKRPEDIVRAACAGVLYQPYTMIVYESTANGVGNFFHREYVDARDNRRSQFRSLFIAWYDIEQNSREFIAEDAECEDDDIPMKRRDFARWLYEHREAKVARTNREESGQYLWWLWRRGATLEGINWYITERAKHSQHGSMAAECPSDDTEAFVNSGAAVFDKYKVEALRPDCRQPAFVGEVKVDTPLPLTVENRLDEAPLDFVPDSQGNLWIWEKPDSRHADVVDRYLAVVDVGGRSYKSDWSVIVVFDRYKMMEGGHPEVVAQWYGHCDIDILAWEAARIAAYYQNALLVIESNTLETHDRDRAVEGDQSHFILNQIRRVYTNLYARRQSEEDIRAGRPRKFGFHTNVSTKPMVISTLVKMVREHLYIERDERCLNEYIVYERKPNGSYGAISGEHDDLLMTRAIGLHICYYEMELPRLAVADCYRPGRIISEATL